MHSPPKSISTTEFVIMLAIMISIVALAIDIMLPTLDVIGQDLNVADPNDTQLVITSLILGFAVGQLIAGPVSDSLGRKPVIYFGYVVFIIGCLFSIFATSFTVMLVGRVLQGLGAASPRIITLALVRDSYEGRAMARIMSIIMAVFILVPAIAPAIGQAIIALSGWRSIFTLLMAMAIISVIWFALRQQETLPQKKRRDFSLLNILDGLKEACNYRSVIGYTAAAGLIFGAFIGYLSAAQQIFQISFEVGKLFPLYFGGASLAIGSASIFNAKLVIRYGMRLLTMRALICSTFVSTIFLIPTIMMDGVPPFWLFMSWLLVTFFCVGIMFGNFHALAMEQLGNMAGLGAAFVGSLSTFISLPLGWVIGYLFDGGILSLVAGFAFLGVCSIAVMQWAEAKPENKT
ncbi:MAG: multidrug effflux MFS transporter [Gammaproteobacteria bacterium]|nr:multidrug effflux MFS transporter [Gammaproteobacteria bacterium]